MVLGLAASCFSAPRADVLFRCEPDGASDCPPDYVCLADGCCHREGASLTEDNFGACGSAMATGSTGASGSETVGSESSAGSSSAGGSTESGTSTGR